MKFRFYQLLQLLVVGLVIFALTEPVMSYVDGGQKTVMENFRLAVAGLTVSRSVMALGVLLIFSAVVNVFAFVVSLFSNFELQKRVSIFSMLVFAGYYIVLLIYSLVVVEGAPVVELGILLPFFGLLLNTVSFNLIRRQEAKIIARASGFRLRD